MLGVKGSQVRILSARPAFLKPLTWTKVQVSGFLIGKHRSSKIALVDIVVTAVVTSGPTVVVSAQLCDHGSVR